MQVLEQHRDIGAEQADAERPERLVVTLARDGAPSIRPAARPFVAKLSRIGDGTEIFPGYR